MSSPRHVAIIGSGFSGTMLAVGLLRRGGVKVTLVERRAAQAGRGVAYSTPHPAQLLNVRAAGMSALPAEPAHFAEWLAANGEGGGADFVPRARYGAYLTDLLDDAGAPERLDRCAGDAIDVVHRADGIDVMLADGGRIAADAAVLALGNLPPLVPPGIDPSRLAPGCYVNDPWDSDPTVGLTDDDTVVLIGTGLTAVDVALQFAAARFQGRILALSRRGLSPRRHVEGAPAPVQRSAPLAGGLSRWIADVRADAAGQDWRGAVDSLRSVTQAMWAAADSATRRRFIRHLRPYWDVHRHRIAPGVADAIDALVGEDRLRFAAGKIVAAAMDGEQVALSWRPRGGDVVEVTRAARIVNCTGPQGDVVRSSDPLIEALRTRGAIRPDALRLGIDVDDGWHVVDAHGRTDPRLFCVGPMTRGAAWEIVAVPDIRHQAADLAAAL